MPVLILLAACSSGPEADPPQPTQPAPAPSTAPAPEPEPTSVTGLTGLTGLTGDTAAVEPPRLFAFVGASDDRIYGFEVDAATGTLTAAGSVAAGPAPTYLALAPDHRHLYAAYEGSDEVASFAVDASTGALTALDRVSSEGDGPAHLTVDATGATALATHYGSGTVTALELAVDGTFGARRLTHATGANAHQLVLDPSNTWAFVPNLGDDSISQLGFDPTTGALVDNAVPTVALADGAGPRHLALHPSAPLAYLLNELDDTLVALAFDAATGRLAPLWTVSTLPAGADAGANYTAEVAIEPTGRFLYASNRGHDSIARFSLDPATGEPALLDTTPTGGSWPRHFSIDPTGDLLLVGNQQSDTVVTFRIDPATGALTELTTTAVPGPAFVGVLDLR